MGWIGSLGGAFAAILLFAAGMAICARPLVRVLFRKAVAVIETDPFPDNLWELVTLTRHISPQILIENSMRAQGGVMVKRPLGSPKKMPDFRKLTFLPCQLDRLPTPEDQAIETRTVIGPCAKKPLELEIPLLVSGMAFGLGISEQLKVALAKGSAMAGTATNGGEGPFLPEERKYADKLILQYSRAKWAKDPEILKQADMIEVHIGQGASAGTPSQVPAIHLKGRAMELMGLKPDDTAEILSRMPGIHRKQDWKKLIDRLRQLTGGVPIGMKMIPGRVEKDLEIAVAAGVDFITLDGAQAGTKGTPPILQDDFGLPAVIGLARAADYLEKKKKKDEISLIISGGLYTPGDFLKALAMGADAVAIGSAVLFAASHDQGSQKTLPWEPPTQLVLYDGDQKEELNVDEGAKCVAHYLQSSVAEMKLAAIALGKSRLQDVDRTDLAARDPVTAAIARVPMI
ncbi:FMN-binding glutamate synthase family protein [Kroppenstedtia eburnea]|uniref:FMN-binding glutamate synthase family protein n=1 Tax=Kroppenstedtia eburnea TaxID=714067 RepID=UPI00363B63CB